jgi:uncharacterized protein YjbI with pentapeptide repeats
MTGAGITSDVDSRASRQRIDPNGGSSRSLEKLMHKQKASAWARERSECVTALGASLAGGPIHCHDGAIALRLKRERGFAPVITRHSMTSALSACALTVFLGLAGAAQGQDMLSLVDLSSPAMTQAELSRDQVLAKVQAASPQQPADFAGTSLNGLDLSGLDLSGANFRAARLNNVNLTGAKLKGAILDQAWMLRADMSSADLTGAALFQTQLQRAKLDGTDFSGARIAADMTGASLKGAKFGGGNLAADMKNQSMGLMRAVFTSADLQGADFSGADLGRANLEFTSLKGANLSRANLMGAQLAGADLTGATITGANFTGVDLDGAKIIAVIGADAANLDQAKNLARATRN